MVAKSGAWRWSVSRRHRRHAPRSPLREPWSNGQAEGQITRLKTLKGQMHGRADIDLLKTRLVAAERTPPERLQES